MSIGRERFTAEQLIKKLEEASEAMLLAEVCADRALWAAREIKSGNTTREMAEQAVEETLCYVGLANQGISAVRQALSTQPQVLDSWVLDADLDVQIYALTQRVTKLASDKEEKILSISDTLAAALQMLENAEITLPSCSRGLTSTTSSGFFADLFRKYRRRQAWDRFLEARKQDEIELNNKL
ncbi:MAG: hypothetical protein A3E83_05055 [Gammaproteobacteria bacterium RIFCSPHIGHO2_12_FULL_41_20]|nr:MAG: hypothetical protein A3E83_05055 [Gammaproteobacteria bacterium RIFCSPHIGHO2_12_FULL_41_20]